MATLIRFAGDETGATVIEYALIGSLICVMIVAGASVLGTKLNGMFAGVASNFD